MAPLHSIIGLVALLSGAAIASSVTCPNDLPLSCHNTSAVTDTCCFVTQGQLLQTQFWDTDPSTGPSDSWTIHGLWPDNCDGSYSENCDPSRDYSNIEEILEQFGDEDTLSYIKTYWDNDDGSNEKLWAHEWKEHGTCISTLDPSCYTDYTTGEEVSDYVNTIVKLFKALPTYTWLEEAGIVPSTSQLYTASEIQAALEAKHGASVTLLCSHDSLEQVYYHFNVQGSLQNGTFVAAEPDGSSSTCSGSSIKYAPKDQ